MSETVAVLGAGSFGTALAKLLAEGGHRTTLWARDQTVVDAINTDHVHPRRMQKIRLPAGLKASTELEATVREATLVVSVVPTPAVRDVWGRAKSALSKTAIIVSATKGIENGTLFTVDGVMKDVLGSDIARRLAFLSGPSFAVELAKRLPTAVTIAAEDEEVAKRVQGVVSNDYFRAYTTTDVIGVEVGGALKNVIAIAAGAADGLGFGANTQAALITRGLAEIGRMAVKLGANPMTLAGLAGMGDLVLTCTGALSRNRTVGFKIGQGQKLPQILAELGEVAEGVNTTRSAHDLARREQVEMPITEGVHRLLFDDVDPRMAVYELMGRKLKAEQG
jgi:glycerol-3-phosphate dehydrogenase (NAD(P)+)